MTLLASLVDGVPQFLMTVRHARTSEIVRIAAESGHHGLMIDLEQAAIPLGSVTEMLSCAQDVGITALVRVPEGDLSLVGSLMNAGAAGIVAPRVETASQAESLVQAVCFPPLGTRSQIGRDSRMRVIDAEELRLLNQGLISKVLIESSRGVENAGEIAQTPGINVVGVGLNDLSADLGHPGDHAHAEVKEAVLKVLHAAEAAGKISIVGGCAPALVREFLEAGAAPLLGTGSDVEMLLDGAADRVERASRTVTA